MEPGIIRWGLIGTGDVAEHKGGPALYKVAGSQLVAVTNRRIDKARSFARRHGVETVHPTVDALLADETIDAVYIATPPGAHLEMVEAAAHAGKHVLCEKPMAMTVSECDRMIAVCRQAGVQLKIAYYRRFFPVVQKMKELVDAGAIGRLLRIRAAVSDRYTPPVDGDRGWLVDPAIAGGGFLTDVATHRLDLFVHFLGKPAAVSGLVDTQELNIAVDDASTVVIRFENGAHASGVFNWNSDVSADEFDIWGTTGRIRSENLGGGHLDVFTAEGRETLHLPPPGVTHLNLVADFVRSLRSGQENALPGEEGRWATVITEAAYRSSTTGRTAVLPSNPSSIM